MQLCKLETTFSRIEKHFCLTVLMSRKKRTITCPQHSITQYFQPKKMDTKKRCPAHSGDRKQVLGTCIDHVNYSQIPVKPLGRVQDTRASK